MTVRKSLLSVTEVYFRNSADRYEQLIQLKKKRQLDLFPLVYQGAHCQIQMQHCSSRHYFIKHKMYCKTQNELVLMASSALTA